MKNIPVKKYKLQGGEFEFEKQCFKLTEELDKIYDLFLMFKKEDAEFAEIQKNYNSFQAKLISVCGKDKMQQINKNPDKVFEILSDYPEILFESANTATAYEQKKKSLHKTFARKNNKMLIETCLNIGDKEINFDIDGEGFTELMNVSNEVLADFFIVMKDLGRY